MPPPPARPARAGRSPPVLAALIALTCLPEIVLLAADLRLVGSPAWRVIAYSYGAFWAGLLRDWQPNYPGQPALMFATYGVLHAGPGHLAGNMLTLAPLGAAVAGWLGRGGLLAVYGAGLGGGGVAFGLLSTTPAPMVGASGAIFGLAGALVARDWTQRRQPARTLAAAAGLVALNALTWALMDGQVAWQAHLGGAGAGATAGVLLSPGRARDGAR